MQYLRLTGEQRAILRWRAEERERCAKVAETCLPDDVYGWQPDDVVVCIAAAIREVPRE